MPIAVGVFGALAALLAVINAVQVLLGRQLVRPAESKRPARQLRSESAAAAVAMLGVSLAAFGVLLGGQWPLLGALVLLAGGIALVLVRRQFVGQS